MPRGRDLLLLLCSLAPGSVLAAGCDTRPVNSRAIANPPAVGGAADGGRRPTLLDAAPASTPDGPSPEGLPPSAGATGAPCERAQDCESGYCADGVCCNVACGGTCVSCNQPGRAGECAAIPSGQKDPRGTCRAEAAESCGQSGFCNGQGGCAKFAPGSACGVATCTGPRTFLPGGECDGDGVCVKGAPIECTPFNCENAACRFSCVADADCVPPNVCLAGRCGLRGDGQTCTAGDQCGSGFCVDGVCCENACTGRCQFCASPSARGKCTAVRPGAPDPRASAGVTDPGRACVDQGVASCGTNGRCDGKGGCLRYEDGASCRPPRCETGSNSEFGESFCMGGSCRSPDGTSCVPYKGCTGARCLTSCTGDNRCSSGFFCTGSVCDKRPQGGACGQNSDCMNGLCAQGRCCNEACDGSCRSCNLEGLRGTCSARTFTSEVDADDDTVVAGEPTFFEDGDPIPAGHYTITYADGCMKYAADQGWTVNATGELGWILIGDTPADRRGGLPGNLGFIPGLGGHVEYDACVAASRMSTPVVIDHPGGKLGVMLLDSLYTDNVTGEDENPTWRLSGTLTCP